MSKFEAFCERYRKQFTHKPGERKDVGIEKEILAVDGEGNMADIATRVWPYLLKEGYKPIYDSYYKDQVVAFDAGNDQIALDAGKGTFEIIMRPHKTVKESEKRMKQLLSVILSVCEKESIKVLALGCQPVTRALRENWNRKQRYEVLLDYFGDPVYPASLSASDQVHVDVAEEEIVSVINVMNGMAGLFVVLFANCPIFDGPNEYKAYREVIWDKLGVDRTGLPLLPMSSLEDYLARTWEMKCIMASDGEKFYSPDVSFKDFVEEMDDDQVYKAYEVHEGSVWFCARPRVYGTIELRPAGLQPWDDMMAVPALALGLLENLNESEMFIKQFRWDTLRALRMEAVKKGFEIDFFGKSVDKWVKEIVDLASKGLEKRGDGDEKYLDALYERIDKKEAPVDRGRQYLKKGGLPLLLEKSSLKERHLKL